MLVQYKNYWAGLGRTILPAKPEPALRKLQNTGERIYSAIIEKLSPGTPIYDVFDTVKSESGNMKSSRFTRRTGCTVTLARRALWSVIKPTPNS